MKSRPPRVTKWDPVSKQNKQRWLQKEKSSHAGPQQCLIKKVKGPRGFWAYSGSKPKFCPWSLEKLLWTHGTVALKTTPSSPGYVIINEIPKPQQAAKAWREQIHTAPCTVECCPLWEGWQLPWLGLHRPTVPAGSGGTLSSYSKSSKQQAEPLPVAFTQLGTFPRRAPGHLPKHTFSYVSKVWEKQHSWGWAHGKGLVLKAVCF